MIGDPNGLHSTEGQNLQDPLRQAFGRLQTAEELRTHGNLKESRKICEDLIKQFPEYFGALYTLGLILMDQRSYPQALGCLVRAVMLNPTSWRARTALATVYLEMGANDLARETALRATEYGRDNPNVHVALGEIYRSEREYELAKNAFLKAIELDGSFQDAQHGLAVCHVNLNKFDEAAALLNKLLSDGDMSIEVIWEIANLPGSPASRDLLPILNKVKRGRAQTEADFQNSLLFIRGALLDRIGRYEEAWSELSKANEEMFSATREAAQSEAILADDNLAQLKNKRIKIYDGENIPDMPLLLFILGPSRSGKTTLEGLVSSLPGVKRGYENPSVERAVRRTFHSAGLVSSSIFEMLPANLDRQFRKHYEDELRWRADGAQIFTNTHPGRIHDVGRLASSFPNTRFVFIKRNIDDNIIRIFMYKYMAGNAYAYSIDTIRSYVHWYHEMIDTLSSQLDGIATVVNYEDIVLNPVAVVNKVAEVCSGRIAGPGPVSVGPVTDDRGASDPYKVFLTG